MKSNKVLLINCDWRNIFQTGFAELKEKLERDRLNPETNEFFLFSWAQTSYHEKKENFQTTHIKTIWRFFRPFIDLLSLVYVPNTLAHYDFKPDAVVVYDFGLLPAAKRIKKKYGSTIILCVNNMPVLYSQTRPFGAIKKIYSYLIERLFGRIADKVFTINNAMETYLLNAGIPREKITIFSMNTINRDQAYIKASVRGEIRKKYNIAPEKKIIITVARLEAEKNYPRLFDTVKALGEEFVLIVLGSGSKLESFKAYVKELGMEERVFFAGFVRRNEIWNYYQDADLFMLLSKAEALGVVVWEAMYMKVPVIGSIAPGIVESTGDDGERGFVYHDDEPLVSLQGKVDFALTPSPERDAMLERAHDYVVRHIQNKVTINDLI